MTTRKDKSNRSGRNKTPDNECLAIIIKNWKRRRLVGRRKENNCGRFPNRRSVENLNEKLTKVVTYYLTIHETFPSIQQSK